MYFSVANGEGFKPPIAHAETIEKLIIEKKNIDEEKQKIIRHASRISNNDMDFILTLDKENAGSWNINKKSPKNKNGTYDKGICQFNSDYYGHYYKDPQWKNAEWQVNKCYEHYTQWRKLGIIGKRFFAWNTRLDGKDNFHYVVWRED